MTLHIIWIRIIQIHSIQLQQSITALQKMDIVTIKILNILGARIATLVNEFKITGNHNNLLTLHHLQAVFTFTNYNLVILLAQRR